jgi:membrane-associated HD superfamily phosphohydrolase
MAINANDRLAECAAFYYRLGKIEGEPMIDNAIKIANNHCLPIDVIQILSEYGGIISLPSTKESAIVHMVDSVVTKVELFDSDSMSSSWNQNMVIYQTINELSQKGFYDNSGLTMNQFLIIREILANEDILA